MDLSQYAELFLAESREHLSACNQLLLEWERSPANLAPVGGLFRAVHTVKGMAAIKKQQAGVPVAPVRPPESGFEADEFDGRFSFRIGGGAGVGEIERAVRAAGDVEHVTVGGEERRAAPGAGGPSAAPETKNRHIRVDLGRLASLLDLIGGPVPRGGRRTGPPASAPYPAIAEV